jgi:hypothetical protein
MQAENLHSNFNMSMSNNINMNQNISYLDMILPTNTNKPKIKLDDILESIKNLKINYNMAEELRSAIKILKRFKMSECSKL